MNAFENLAQSKFPSYDPYRPLVETTGIKVENSEYMDFEELAECFLILSKSALNLDLNCFIIAYHIVMGPDEPLKKSEVKRLKNEHERLRKQQLAVN